MTIAAAQIGPQRRFIGTRYRLLNPIGAGGMGHVYRAEDRLTGEPVALKQVAAAGWDAGAQGDLQLALAAEFQALAALRHPHIIAVRDFGFDDGGRPFFTMELLHAPLPITEAAQWADDALRTRWLWQLLLALDYIHRAGIVHRDLKPGNVLIIDDSARVVDFGLATLAGTPAAQSGTLGYIAPEIIGGAPPSPQSDLYAVGVLAYQIFAGWHPLGETVNNLAQRALQQTFDFSFVSIGPALQAVIEQLAARDPAERFPDARAAILALAAASGLPLPAETAGTRESFLVAAPFTGRADELARLQALLVAARDGQGDAWLIAGESGIGKSRLLAELRTRALIDGVVVAVGEAAEDGSTPYRLLSDVLRRLVLLAPPDDLSAAVLTAIVPDLATLLQRPLPPAPPLPPEAAQTRLHTTVLALIAAAAARRPLLILLEDIHWSDVGSLKLIDFLTQQIAGLPVLLLATYRPGERHDLASGLPAMRVMLLDRLPGVEISTLARAMLTGRAPSDELLTLLERETEGNTFFVVEVLRALAEEAGQLGAVGDRPLPLTVAAGGIERVIRRRLARVHVPYRPMLVSAAVAGRRIDLTLLQRLDPDIDLDNWLTVCANGGVLNQPADRLYWQFSHDKLRAGLLADLPAATRSAEHRRIAEALEAVYHVDLTPHYAAIAYHYIESANREPAIRYLRLAADAAQNNYAHAAALTHFEQLEHLVESPRERAAIALQSGRTLRFIGEWEPAEARYRAALAAAEALADDRLRADTLLELGRLARLRADYASAHALLTQAADLFRAADDPGRLCETVVDLANVHYQQGEYAAARQSLIAIRPLAARADPAVQALVLHNLGSVAYAQGQYETAEAEFDAVLTLRRQLGDRAEIANSLNNLGLAAFRLHRYPQATALFEESLMLRRAIDDRLGIAASLNNLGMIPYQQGEYAIARRYWEECVAVRRTLGAQWTLLHGLDNLALVASAQGDYATAAALLDEVIATRRQINDRQGLAITLGNRARVALHQDDPVLAGRLYLESTQLAQAIGDQLGIVFGLAGSAAALGLPAVDDAARLDALRLLAAAEALREQTAAAWETDERRLYEMTRAALSAALPPQAFGQAWRTGSALTADDAVTLAAQAAARLIDRSNISRAGAAALETE